VPAAPAASCALCIGKKHTSKRVHGNHPAFPHAMVLTAYVALSPVTGLFATVVHGLRFCPRPVGPTNLRELDASVGASGPHDFAVRVSAVRLLAQMSLTGLIDPPCQPIARQRCRVHRIPPRVPDDRDTPLLWGGMTRVLDVIWGSGNRNIFRKIRNMTRHACRQTARRANHLSRSCRQSAGCVEPRETHHRHNGWVPFHFPAHLPCHRARQ
jgi:hypothetical protein